MSDAFTDRLREATVDDRLLEIPKLKEAANAASTNLNAQRALALLLAAHHRPLPPDDELDLRRRLNSEDPVIAAETGDRQLLAVLAAEALILAFSRERAGVGLIPGLGVRCAAHAGWRPVHADLTSAAAAYLLKRAIFLRVRFAPQSKLSKDKPKAEEGTAARALEELDVLRGVVQHDRQRSWERDQLAWWLLSETRPESSLAIALEYAQCLLFLPEPPATREMIAAKLGHPSSDALLSPVPVQIDAAISELCADVGADPESSEDGGDFHRVLRVLDQIMLARAFAEAA